MANYHTVPNNAGGWEVKKEGARRASAAFDTQKEAMEKGKELAKKNKGEHLIHGKDGKIRARDSYGHDPFPPRG